VRVLLIGNYGPDRQESMARYATLLHEGLQSAGHEVSLAVPRNVLNPVGHPASGPWKWVGYVDKLVVAPAELRRLSRGQDVVHICDHSNSVYVPRAARVPHVVTCHDLLAVRGALGEDTDCPAGFTGRQLQRSIVNGLRRADAVACVSRATLRDAERLVGTPRGRLCVVPNALNHPYCPLPRHVVLERLRSIPELDGHAAFVLHIGSNLRRKNRECVLRAMANVAERWSGQLVFAGQPLSTELRALAGSLGIAGRIVEVEKPDNDQLEALYNAATALLFPSRFEGFGWPIIEAQASGCPVICSNREPFPEVAGDAAILCDADDDHAFGEAILQLAQSAERRTTLSEAGIVNARRYERSVMIRDFVSLYEAVVEVQ